MKLRSIAFYTFLVLGVLVIVGGTLGSALQGGIAAFKASKELHSTVQTAVGDAGSQFQAAQLNAGIKNLKVTKNVGKGIITISFEWRSKDAGYYYFNGRGLLVRLFDGNGQYLTHFTTEETFVDIMGTHDPRTWEGGSFTLNYPVNELVLKAAKQAEVGAYMSLM